MIAMNNEGGTGLGLQYKNGPDTVRPAAADLHTATTARDIIQAWRLVYHVYLGAGLIDANPYEVHTTPATVNGNTVVFMRKSQDDRVQCTVTGVVDGPNGIPLDSVYESQIDQLRSQGRRVMELGLFAHKNQLPSAASLDDTTSQRGDLTRNEIASMVRRGGQSLMRLMGPTYWYGLHHDVSDFLIGVHPKHARFYTRSWGFEPYGPQRSYSVVNDRPVVLLRFDRDKVTKARPMPYYALGHAMSNPLPRSAFADHLDVDLRKVRILNDTITKYIRLRYPESELAA